MENGEYRPAVATEAGAAASTSASVTPSVGANVEDSAVGAKVTIPANALGSSTSAVTVTIEKVFSAPETATTKILGDALVDIETKDNTAVAVTQFNSAVTIELAYTDAQVQAAGITEDYLTCVFLDETAADYINLPGVIDKTNNKLTCSTTHATDFGIGFSQTTTTTSTSSSSGGGAGARFTPLVTNNSLSIDSDSLEIGRAHV